MTAIDLAERLGAGTTTSREITAACLDRIKAIDKPRYNAVIETNPDALTIAAALDAELARGVRRGPLHGIPVLVKANIDTADRMATSAGSTALRDHFAQRDAPIVDNLRRAGAIVLGKTNLSEWAGFRSRVTVNGWSSVGGQTQNAWIPGFDPGGSSSGSAVAVAARMAPLAVGTETCGSIVSPASRNHVVGIKPRTGVLDNRGIVPIASYDTPGAFARTQGDAELLIDAMAGKDRPIPVDRSGARVGVFRAMGNASADTSSDALAATMLDLEAKGAQCVPFDITLPTSVRRAFTRILRFEFRERLNDYLVGVRDGPADLAKLVEWTATQPNPEQPDRATLEAALAETNVNWYRTARQTCWSWWRQVQARAADAGLQSIIADANSALVRAIGDGPGVLEPLWVLVALGGYEARVLENRSTRVTGIGVMRVNLG